MLDVDSLRHPRAIVDRLKRGLVKVRFGHLGHVRCESAVGLVVEVLALTNDLTAARQSHVFAESAAGTDWLWGQHVDGQVLRAPLRQVAGVAHASKDDVCRPADPAARYEPRAPQACSRAAA